MSGSKPYWIDGKYNVGRILYNSKVLAENMNGFIETA